MQEETQQKPEQNPDPLQSRPERSPVRWIIGGLVLVALLAGAAFTGARLLGSPDNQASPGSGPNMVFSAEGPGGGDMQQISLNLVPAPELPQTDAEVQGILQSREDNSLMVGTGNIQMMVSVWEGETNLEPSFDGPVLEVVVTGETEIYQDVTEQLLGQPDVADRSEDGTITIEQRVELRDTLDDIDANAEVTVWGERSGDRVIARVLVFRNFG